MAVLLVAGCTSGRADEPTEEAAGGGVAEPSRTAEPGRSQGRDLVPPASPAHAETWVVTLGDSYISGEGARYAANTSADRDAVDALGQTAYDDSRAGETLPGCHRAEIWPGLVATSGVGSLNLACSGATTESYRSGVRVKPGLDFERLGATGVGQARALQRFARRHQVTDVVVSIGGNDAGFGRIVATCVLGFLDPQREAGPCSQDPLLTALVERPALDEVSRRVAAALDRVASAMRRAGYEGADYAVTVATYPSPLPPADLLRYDERDRRTQRGGCPVFDVDADWAARVVVPRINAALRRGAERSVLENVGVLDLQRALVGHRLCEEGAARLDELAADDWREAGIVDQVEWVNEVSFDFSRTQESLHPNYWGTLVLRACVEAAVAGDEARSARCVVARQRGSSQSTPAVRLAG